MVISYSGKQLHSGAGDGGSSGFISSFTGCACDFGYGIDNSRYGRGTGGSKGFGYQGRGCGISFGGTSTWGGGEGVGAGSGNGGQGDLERE